MDFIKQFTPYAWNLRSAPIFFHNLALCICALRSTYCIFSQIWVCFTLCAVRPTFMKSTPGSMLRKYFLFEKYVSNFDKIDPCKVKEIQERDKCYRMSCLDHQSGRHIGLPLTIFDPKVFFLLSWLQPKKTGAC
jgi:hypothetical protein